MVFVLISWRPKETRIIIILAAKMNICLSLFIDNSTVFIIKIFTHYSKHMHLKVWAIFSDLHTLILPLYTCVDMKSIPVDVQVTLYIFGCHTESILSASQECAQQRWAAQMVVLTAGERTSNKAGRCQLGSRCLKHQFLAAGYKVILDGFITDSLCQSVFRTPDHVWYIIFHSTFTGPFCVNSVDST